MKFLTKILFLSLSIFALASCSSSDDDDTNGSDPEPNTYRHSVIVYLAAQNSLGYT